MELKEIFKFKTDKNIKKIIEYKVESSKTTNKIVEEYIKSNKLQEKVVDKKMDKIIEEEER